MILVAYGQVWYASDDAAEDPVRLFREDSDLADGVDPVLIVPRAVTKQPRQVAEPMGVGVPVWDADGRVWFRRHDTGTWVSPTASGFDQSPWLSLNHPVRFTQPGTVRLPGPDSPVWRLLLGELRRFAVWLRDNPGVDEQRARGRLLVILRSQLG